ncbi:MAG TPA: tetratricopeptide repeat protein [Myxococcales bacterium]|nr:tetratricopeptide repeat protein [Myxococcales bacterium]
MGQAVFLVVLLANTPSGSQRKEALRLAHQSVLEYNEGEFQAALRDLKRAYLLDPKPGMLFDLGQCHRALADWKDAEFAFRSYLRESPAGAHRDQAKALLADVQAKLAAEEAPPPVVEVPPVPLQGPAVSAPPAAAVVAAPAPPRHHSHALAIVLGALGVAAGGAAAYFGVQLYGFEAERSVLDGLPAGAATTPAYSYAAVSSAASNARLDRGLGLGLAIAGVAGVVAAACTW